MTHNELADAVAARCQAQTKLEAAIAATERARETVSVAAAEVARLVAEERGLEERYATELEEKMLASQEPPMLALVPSAREGFVRQREAAFRHGAAQRALVRLESAENAARAALQAAQQHEQAALNEAKRGEADRLAGRMRQLWSEYRDIYVRIATLDLDNFRGDMLSPATIEVMEAPLVVPSIETLSAGTIAADVNTPINGDRSGIEPARAYWRDFEAKLRSAAEPAEQAA